MPPINKARVPQQACSGREGPGLVAKEKEIG